MKKLLATVIAAALSLGLLAACAPEDNTELPDLGGVTYAERTGEVYKDSKEGKERIKISYTPGYGDDWVLQMAKAFLLDDVGANYYIEIDSDSELTTAVASKLQSGMNLSDIYFPLASLWQDYAASGWLANLDDLYSMTVPGEDVTVLDKIKGSWKDYGKSVYKQEEHYYVFPGNENITGFVYNKTLFDEYNWEVPETVDDFDELCQKIIADTNGKIAPIVYPGKIAGGYWDFVGKNWWLQVSGVEELNTFMQFDDAEVFNADKRSSPSYGKLKMLETFEKVIVKNRQTYTLRGSASKDHLQSQVSFLQRQAAMIPNGNWIEKESLKEMKDEVRMMYTPAMKDALKDKDGNYLRFNYSGQPDYMLIPAKAKCVEGAKLFLAFMCKDEVLKTYTTSTGTVRPFEYDLSECEVTPFTQSCFDIWSNSTTWFEQSKSPLWTANKIKVFNLSNPFTNLLADQTISANGWCASEYTNVKNSWQGLLDSIKS